VKTYLDAILESHRQIADGDPRRLDQVMEKARIGGEVRSLAHALKANGLSVIAEIKKRSPSKGDLNPGLDPANWSASYERGGAAAISVLTDREFFGGSPRDLEVARRTVNIPVLRKDFTVCELDVCDAKIMGADAILLIVAALDDQELRGFHELATELGMDCLVETHDEAEVERALDCGANIIGVNQRDLVTFKVDQERAVRVGESLPDNVVKVAESGVSGVESVGPLVQAGYDAVLVGEALVSSKEPEEAVRALRAPFVS